MGVIADRIRRKLQDALDPAQLELVDESHLHAGHAGHNHQGESHFALTISSAQFSGHSRIARQRMVYAILAEELRGQVHALRMTLSDTEGSFRV